MSYKQIFKDVYAKCDSNGIVTSNLVDGVVVGPYNIPADVLRAALGDNYILAYIDNGQNKYYSVPIVIVDKPTIDLLEKNIFENLVP